MVVIERILLFPVTSPLMRVLTGLEVLLKKSQVRLPRSIDSDPKLVYLYHDANYHGNTWM